MDGVLFGNKHSYRDWGLILKSRPVIGPPPVKTVYTDIPGSDGNIDMTESLTGEIQYGNRPIICEFWVINGIDRWAGICSEILDYLHGQKMKIIFDDDPNYYYIGRLKINEWKSNSKTSVIVIEGNAEPYKLERFSSLENWEWDSFNFETGIIREYKELVVEDELKVIIPGRRKIVIPSFICSSAMEVKFNDSTYQLPAGESRVLNIALSEGENVLTFTGTGLVSIDYRGGRL